MMNKNQIKDKISQASGPEMELVWIPEIMKNQTRDEQACGMTIEVNHVGLNAYDADLITSLSRQVTSGDHLTIKQLSAARKVLPKYAAQYQAMMT